MDTLERDRLPTLPALTWLQWLGVLALYGSLAILATFPLILHMPTSLPADPTERAQDVWQHFWNLWWVRERLWVHPGNPYFTDALFYPTGASLGLHTLNLPTNALGAPLVPLLGIVATFNLIVISTLAGTGVAMFLLARHVSGSNLAALVAGVMVQCSPLRLDQVRLSLMATWNDFGVVLALLALLIALERRTWRSAAVAAAAVWLAGLNNWYHLFHTMLLFSMLFGWRVAALLWATPASARWAALRREVSVWLRVGGLAGILIAPFAFAGVVDALTNPFARKDDLLVSSAEVQRLLPLAQTFGFIWQPVPADWLSFYVFAFSALALALLGLVLAPHATSKWLVLAGGFLILSLGPTLYWDRQDTGIVLPYAFFRALPGFEVFRGPYRLNANTTIMLALVAAVGLAHLLPRLRPPVAASVAAVAIALLVAEGVRLPFPLRDATRSPFYAQVAQQAGEWSLVEFPFGRPDRALQDMYTQAHHGKPIFDGHLSRDVVHFPPESIPPLQAIDRRESRTDIITLTAAQQTQLLQGLRLRYLIFHANPRQLDLIPQQVAIAREQFGSLTQVYSDTELVAYEVDQLARWLTDAGGPPERVPLPLFVGLDIGWEPLEIGPQGWSRWLPKSGATLWVYAPTAQRARLTLHLYHLGPEPLPLEVTLNGAARSRVVVTGGQQLREVQLLLDLRRGANQVDLFTPAEGVSPLSLGLSNDARRLTFNIKAITVDGLGGE